MTPEQRMRIFDELSDVLISDFQRDFSDVLAEAYATTSFTPEQANNEIRNAMIHCARACAAVTMEDAEKQIEQARWHIDLAKRDCLKICILKTRMDIDSILEASEYRFKTIKIADRARLKAISMTTKALLKRELTDREQKNITNEYESIYDDISDFLEHILNTYPITNARSISERKYLKFIKRPGPWIVGIIIIAILSLPFLPQRVKVSYSSSVKYIFCKIASDPSCY